MEIALVVVVVLALAAVQVRRRGSKLQRPEDPRAGVTGAPGPTEGDDRS